MLLPQLDEHSPLLVPNKFSYNQTVYNGFPIIPYVLPSLLIQLRVFFLQLIYKLIELGVLLLQIINHNIPFRNQPSPLGIPNHRWWTTLYSDYYGFWRGVYTDY